MTRCNRQQIRTTTYAAARSTATPAKARRRLHEVGQLAALGMLLALWCVATVGADEAAALEPSILSGTDYQVQPGDSMFISVWREETLQREVTVQPDGGIRFPLAGEIDATGLSLAEIEQAVAARLSQFIPEPVVSVSLLQSLGNRIYVLGRVNNPGEYVVSRNVDVLQALALAGGLTPFAKQKDIRIIRGQEGAQRVFHFDFAEVKKGQDLQQNILLRPGDTVVVP